MSGRFTFDDVWGGLSDVEGWLHEGQARMLHDAAREVEPGGTIVEIGSFRGRSTIVLAASAPEGARVIAIDPHAGTDRGPREFTTSTRTGDADHAAFEANLAEAGVRDRVEHVRASSDAAHAEVGGDIDLLFIDGAHRYAPARDDIVGWGGRVRTDGVMLIHDSFNSVGVTGAQLRTLVFDDEWAYEGRSNSLSRYRRRPLGRRERAVDAARQLAQLGYFARAVAIKLALSAGRAGLAARLGHSGEARWPY